MSTERFPLMHELVASPPLDLPLDAWFELYEQVVEFRPDWMLELGRGWGNSTCVLTEAANELGAHVVSIGFDSEHAWATITAPRLLPHVGERWFDPLTVLQADITEVDFGSIVDATAARTFVFWDAHGEDVARVVLERLVPLLPAHNLVVVDDVWPRDAAAPLEPEYFGGPLASPFEEVVPLWAYLSARDIAFRTGTRWVSFTAPVDRERVRHRRPR